MSEGERLGLEGALRLGRGQTVQLHREYVNPALTRMLGLLGFDQPLVRAQGMYLWDEDGREYLDFLGGFGSLNLGHNPPAVWEALEKVAEKPNLLQAALNPLAGALAHDLARVAPGQLEHSFFCNSGAEAVEGAVKLARVATGRSRIVSCLEGFHGKTMGSLSVSGREKYQKPFKPLLPGCESIPFGDIEALEQALAPGDVSAFVVEPIQGEGGIIVPPAGYLARAQELCRQFRTLLVLDEIQTGLGRTGSLFAAEQEELEPDVMCLAKSLGGGLMPIGAVMATARVWNEAYGTMERSTLHTSTFGGSTLACAAGLASLDEIVRQGLSRRAATRGEQLLAGLKELQRRFPLVREVRGQGLLVGLEFEQPEKSWLDRVSGGQLSRLGHEYMGALVAAELRHRHGIITAYTLNNPNVIRLEPPLIVEERQVQQVLDALEETFQQHGNLFSLAYASGKTALSSFMRKDR